MIIAKVLHYMTSKDAALLNWNKMTHGFSDAAIDAYIDMQNNKADKLAVCDMMMQALKNDNQKHIDEDKIIAKLMLIKSMVEQGVYSPYKEIERLMNENGEKDRQILILMAQLENAKNDGDELKETDLITQIVEQAVRLGVDVARNVELVLRRIYSGTTKFAKQFNWLVEYIADPDSKSAIVAAIKKVNEDMEKLAKKVTPKIENYKPTIHSQNNFFRPTQIVAQDQNLLD